jgi:hypothetical protein
VRNAISASLNVSPTLARSFKRAHRAVVAASFCFDVLADSGGLVRPVATLVALSAAGAAF